METISIKMLNTLRQAEARLGQGAKTRLADFIRSQVVVGGFIDKNGNEDIYYTSFGLLLSLVMDIKLEYKTLQNSLKEKYNNTTDLIHYAAYVRSMMMLELMQRGEFIFMLKSLFIKQGTLPQFATFPHNDEQSPYSQFILLSLKEDLNKSIGNKKQILNSIEKYKSLEGGYSNIQCGSSTTNATVAALAVKGQLNRFKIDNDIKYLQDIQGDSGGFYATTQAPLPDLLSTATALFVLSCYGVKPRVETTDFIEAHWTSSGGFCATLLDNSVDIEYTFYGLLALGA